MDYPHEDRHMIVSNFLDSREYVKNKTSYFICSIDGIDLYLTKYYKYKTSNWNIYYTDFIVVLGFLTPVIWYKHETGRFGILFEAIRRAHSNIGTKSRDYSRITNGKINNYKEFKKFQKKAVKIVNEKIFLIDNLESELPINNGVKTKKIKI